VRTVAGCSGGVAAAGVALNFSGNWKQIRLAAGLATAGYLRRR